MTRWFFRSAAALMLSCACVVAPAGATKYAGEFMKIPVGARAVALGGAFTAISDDATSPYWNPAGMVYLPYREAFVQHAEQFGSLLNHDFGSYVMPLGAGTERRAALGVNVTWLAANDIPVTPRPGDLRPGIDFNDYGPDNDPLTPDPGQSNNRWDPGERLLLTADDFRFVNSGDVAVGLSYARQRGKRWAFGGTLKFVRQAVPDTIPGEKATSFGAGLDAGVLYMPSDAVTLGAMLRDVTTTYLSWSNGTKEKVDPTITTGSSFQFHPAERHALTWGLDLAWSFDNRKNDAQLKLGGITADLRTGLEYWYRSTLALRTGVNGKDLAFGLGARYKHIGFDYAAQLNRFFAADDPQFPADTNLDATHQVSASYSW